MQSLTKRLLKQVQRGFTLIELLIVVIILAILAAIVIPQFTSATADAQESALDANLANLRSAIELFKVQHRAAYPGSVAATGNGTVPTCTSPGAGTINTAQAFMDHLLLASDALGNTCTVGDITNYKFGPYLRKGIPADPITQKGSVVGDIAIQITGAPLPATAAGTGGWAYETRSGQIYMNSPTKDSKGVNAYSTH